MMSTNDGKFKYVITFTFDAKANIIFQYKALLDELETLSNYAMLAAAFVTYLPEKDESERM